METEKTTAIVPRPNGAPPQQDVIRAPGLPPQENYVNGFEGMATAAFAPEIAKILRAPIPEQDVEIKPDGIVYLPGMFYRQRLTDAFGPGGWSIAPRSPAKRAPAAGGELVMYHGALWCHGRYVSEAVGQCVYYPNNAGMTYADAFEGAKTDAITRCCKDLFIASELWDPTWRAQWQDKYARKVTKRAQIWNAETRKKEWGEKEVWERISRAQKLGVAPAGAAGATSGDGLPKASSPVQPSGTGASTAIPFTSSETSQSADPGEAMTPEELKDLVGLIRELKWRKQFTSWWFTGRFGVEHDALSKAQLRTACSLLLAFARGGADSAPYKQALADAVAAGKCKP